MISTPYLTLRDRLSQTWLNKYTIALLLLSLKLLLFQSSLQNSVNSAKEYTLNSCATIDSYASNVISLPHYLSKSANFMIEKSVEEVNEKTLETLKLLLTASEHLIIFAINMVIGTYACVLVSAVDGAVDVAVNGTETMISFVNTTLDKVTNEIEDGLDDVSKVLNKLISAGEKIKDFFDGKSSNSNSTESLSRVNLTVSSLKKLSIPSSINAKLEQLKGNVPDFTTVQNKTESLIKEPFELVKTKITNATLFPNSGNDLYVPELNKLTICSANSDKINEFYLNVARDMKIICKVFVILLFIGAFLMIIPVIWEEWRQWRKLKVLEGKIKYITNSEKQKPAVQLNQQDKLYTDPIDAFDQTFHKYFTWIGDKISHLLTSSSSRQLKIRWLCSYILSQRAVILLSLALLGLLAVLLQFVMLCSVSRAIQNHDLPFESTYDEMKVSFDESITNWTDSTNNYLSTREHDINDEMFGWVRSTTQAVNSTINTVVDDLNTVIADAFNGTILYDPVKTVVGCVITNKLLKIEEGLTWVHDKATVSLPRVNNQYLLKAFGDNYSLVANSNNTDVDLRRYSYKLQAEATSNSNSEMFGKTEEILSMTKTMMENLLKSTINQYKASLRLELWIALALLGIWLTQLVIALIVVYIDHLTSPSLSQSPAKEQEKEKENHRVKMAMDEVKISYPRELTKDERTRYGYPYKSALERSNTYLEIRSHHNIRNDSKETLTPQIEKKSTLQHPWQTYSSVQTSSSVVPDELREQVQTPYSVPPSKPQNPFITNPFEEGEDPFADPIASLPHPTTTTNKKQRDVTSKRDRFSALSNPFDTLDDDELSVLELKDSNEVNERNYRRNLV